MLTRLLLAIFMVTAFQNTVFAYDFERALNNLSDEFVQCASFFTIANAATENTPNDNATQKQETLSKLNASYEKMIDLALLSSSQEVVMARYKINVDEMSKKIKYNYSNISILFVEYIELCPEARDKPFQRLKYWLDKK